MAVLWISYDLRDAQRDYASLHAALKALGSWAKPLEALWFVETAEPATAVRDVLKRHMGPTDSLLVMPAAHGWAGLKVPQHAVSWINKARY